MKKVVHWTEDQETLEEFVRGRIQGETKRELESHLERCDVCRGRLGEELAVAAGIRKHARRRIREELKSAIDSEEPAVPWSRIAGIAAVLFIVAGIGYFNRWFFSGAPQVPLADSLRPQQRLDRPATSEVETGELNKTGPGEPARETEKSAQEGFAAAGKQKPALKKRAFEVAAQKDEGLWLSGEIEPVASRDALRPDSDQPAVHPQGARAEALPDTAISGAVAAPPATFLFGGRQFTVRLKVDSSLAAADYEGVRGLLREDPSEPSLLIIIPPSLAALSSRGPQVLRNANDSLRIGFGNMVVLFHLPPDTVR